MKPKIQFLQLLIITVLFIFNSTSLSYAKPRDKDRWNKKYDIEIYLFGEKPIPFLVDNIEILRKGKALDVAMGEGRNGVYLAIQGYDVTGLDISEKGLEKAHALAAKHNVNIKTKVVDLENIELEANSYDLILCTYFMIEGFIKNFMPRSNRVVWFY